MRVLLPFAVFVAAPLAAQQASRHVLRGADVAIYNLAGTVRIQGGAVGDVVVEVTPRGGEAAKLRVETGPIDSRQTLRVVYPGDEIVYGQGSGRNSTELRVRDDGTFGDTRGRDRGRSVRVRNYGSGVEVWADLTITVPAGRKVAVRLAVGEASVADVDSDLLVDVHSADITAERTRGRLVLDTGSGDISLRDARGDVTLDTGSGNVRATGVQGDLLIDTGSGNVTVAQADVTSLSIDTGSGNVDARDVRARDLLIDTGSGSVTLTLLSDVESASIDTGSGDVTMTVPSTLGAELDIQTSSGEIDLGFPVEVRRIERSHLQGRIGNGSGRIAIDTGSGDVRLLHGGS